MKCMRALPVVAFALLVGLLLDRWAGPTAPEPPAVPSVDRPDADTSLAALPAAAAASAAHREAVPATAAPSGERGAITGTVEDGAGAPIAGACCKILWGSAPIGLAALVSSEPRPRETVAEARSDARGAFRIEVPTGFWVLRIEAEAMSPWEESALRPGDSRRVRLRPARELLVHVRGEAGGAIAAADVALLRGEFYDRRQAVLTEWTNDAGLARLGSVPSGTWHVHVSHPDFVGVVSKVPASVPPGAALDIVMARGIRIVGQVSLAGGQPLAAPARIRFETLDGFRSSHDVDTQPTGRYASRVVFAPHRPLEIAALAPGLGEARREVSLGAIPASGEVCVDLVFDAPERHAVGRVVDASGAPLGGAEVYVKPLVLLPPETTIHIPSAPELLEHGLPDLTAHDPQESKVARLRRVSTADDQGRFRIGGLHARKAYQVLVVSERHANATVWIEPGEPGSTADVGAVTLGNAGRVWGHVRRADGSPVEGALVYTAAHTSLKVEPDTDFKTKRPAVLRSLADAITNDEGEFAIEPFPAAEFQLMCNGTAFGPYTLAAGATLGPLELVTEDTHRLAAERAARVVLRVKDEASAPVSGVYAQMLRARPDAADPAAFSFHDWTYGLGDGSGRVELRAGEGRYDVEVKDIYGMFEPQRLALEVAAEGLEREVYLTRKPTRPPVLAGVVRTSAGHSLGNLQVVLIPETGDTSCHCLKLDVRTDAQGAFTFGRFMPGNHRLIVNDPDGRMRPVHYYPARPGEPIVVTLE